MLNKILSSVVRMLLLIIVSVASSVVGTILLNRVAL
jgi:hypothetical protein